MAAEGTGMHTQLAMVQGMALVMQLAMVLVSMVDT
jgi:hypothetical protein